MAASAVSTTGRARRTVAPMIGALAAMAGRDVAVDLIDENDRVAHDHAGERDQTEQGHEAERPVGDEQRTGRPDQPERRGREHEREPREALQLDHQERQHHDGHDREHGDQRAVGLDALLDRSAGLDAVAVGQRILDRLQLRLTSLLTSGACTWSTMSPRTVSTMSRLRRHRIGSSNS